jgi:hypothetical protein
MPPPKKTKLSSRKGVRPGVGKARPAATSDSNTRPLTTGKRNLEVDHGFATRPPSHAASRRSSHGSSSSSVASSVSKARRGTVEASPRTSSRADAPLETPRAAVAVNRAYVGEVRDEMRMALRTADARGEMPFPPSASGSKHVFFSDAWLAQGGQSRDAGLDLDA